MFLGIVDMRNRRSLSIRWKIFIYLIGFTAFLLFLVWYFQIVHLNRFYKYFKKDELQEAALLLENNINSESMEEYFIELAEEYDMEVNLLDSDGKSICSTHINEYSHIYIISPEYFNDIIRRVNEGNGVAMYEVDGRYREENKEKVPESAPELIKPEESDSDPVKPEKDFMFRQQINDIKSMVYVKEIQLPDGEINYLMVSSLITPVDATVYTLRIQFVYISVIFLVLAILIALVISQLVSKPIVKINKSAKQLAEGDFDIHFEGAGYKEVQELSHTLNYAADELGRTEQLQKDLLANVSHDLRTPLTMITAYAEVMRDIPGENNPENVQVIIDEATRLTTLVNDMLDLSKIQSGVSDLQRVYFDFTTNILSVLKRFAKLTEQAGYSIRFEYRDNVRVFADEYKIYQVVYNLINNAINYAGEDKEVIVRQIVHGDIIRLEVEDHGKGIAESELYNIWDRYYKVDKTHRRAIQGSGLGLSIVQSILKLHDYKYGVRSTVGKGSIFWFELPKAVGEEMDEDV